MLLTELGQTHKRRRNNAGGVLFAQDYEESSLFAGKCIKLLKPKNIRFPKEKKMLWRNMQNLIFLEELKIRIKGKVLLDLYTKGYIFNNDISEL